MLPLCHHFCRDDFLAFSKDLRLYVITKPFPFRVLVDKDPLSRQVTEAILIKNHQGILLNSKSEFYQPPLVRVRQEVVTGLEE